MVCRQNGVRFGLHRDLPASAVWHETGLLLIRVANRMLAAGPGSSVDIGKQQPMPGEPEIIAPAEAIQVSMQTE